MAAQGLIEIVREHTARSADQSLTIRLIFRRLR
jgi:hypothetical protein